MLWRYPKHHRYWQDIIKIINSLLRIKLPVDTGICLLNIIEESSFSECVYVIIARILFQAWKLIAQKWISIYPPTVEEWRIQKKEAMLKEKFIFLHRACQGKFEAIWRRWLEVLGPHLERSFIV